MSDELRRRLEEVDVPDAGAAEERSWRVVRAAFESEEHRPARSIRRRVPIAVALVATLIAVLMLSPAGATVRHWIADAIDPPGEKNAKPALTGLPGGGKLLVQSQSGPWLVSSDGSRRLLGDYDQADLSPRGRFVIGARGRQLSAITPQGVVRWSRSSRRPVRDPQWESYPGFRIAYRSGASLRVVFGDGTSDRLIAHGVDPVGAAWRPIGAEKADGLLNAGQPLPHALTFARDDRVSLELTDSRRELWHTRRLGSPIESLSWSADGNALLVRTRAAVFLIGRDGRVLSSIRGETASAAIDGDGQRVATISRRPGGGSLMRVVARSNPSRSLAHFAGPGRFDSVDFSPDGKRVLLSWKAADQWLFLRIADEKVMAIDHIARQFSSGGTRGDRSPGGSFPRVLGWCCPAADQSAP